MSYTLAAILLVVSSSAVHAQPTSEPPKPVVAPAPDDDDDTVESDPITSGIEALMRIDGKGRGAAGGLGLAYAVSDAIELELAAIKSNAWGAYAGVRYRFLDGSLHPYAAAGVPMFFFTDDSNNATAAVGGRLAAGIELIVSRHFSVEADLGVEHFFNVGDTVYMNQRIETTVFVPTLGVIGRM